MQLENAYVEKFGNPPERHSFRDPYVLAELRRQYPNLPLSQWQLQASQAAFYFPRIEDNRKIFFGGNQAWFPRKAQQAAGCGPVAAANTVACLLACQHKTALAINFEHNIPYSAYTAWMQHSYDVMGTLEIPLWHLVVENMQKKPLLPPSLGRAAGGYERGLLRLALQNNLPLTTHRLPTPYAQRSQALAFIRTGLATGCPVTLLTTQNRHPLSVYWGAYTAAPKPQPKGMKAHFVTIVGIRPGNNGPELLASSWGHICAINFNALHASWQSPLALGSEMLWFSPTVSQAQTRKDIAGSYLAAPKNAIQTSAGLVFGPRKKQKRQ